MGAIEKLLKEIIRISENEACVASNFVKFQRLGRQALTNLQSQQQKLVEIEGLLKRMQGFCDDNKWKDEKGGKLTIALHIDQIFSLLRQLEDEQKPCATCGGTGFDPKSGIGRPRGNQSPCPDCKGTGLQQPAEPEPTEFTRGKWLKLNNKAKSTILQNAIDDMKNCWKEIDRLAAENKRLKPFEIAVKKRHNGYDPEVCKELGINPPESPEQALQELQDEWNRMENNYVEQIVKLQKKIKQLENPDGK